MEYAKNTITAKPWCDITIGTDNGSYAPGDVYQTSLLVNSESSCIKGVGQTSIRGSVRSCIEISGGWNHRISNIRIAPIYRRVGQLHISNYGIYINEDATEVLIENCIFRHTPQLGYIGVGPNGSSTFQKLTIKNCQFQFPELAVILHKPCDVYFVDTDGQIIEDF